MQYHVNGKLVPAEDAVVPVADRGFLYGDAAFETLRVYNGTIFEWKAHLERLENTCSVMGMPDAIPVDLRERVTETLAANELIDAYVRVSITRGIQPGKLTPQPDVDPTVVIIVSELPRAGIEGTSVWEEFAAVEIVETRKIDSMAMPAELKTHNYLNGILARLELREVDGSIRADEALLLDREGFVAEGTTSNVFFVDDGILHTPSLEEAILPGITRRVVLDLVREESIPAETGRYRPERLREAEELFLTNTTAEVWPVSRIDGRGKDSGPVTERLKQAFDELIETFY